MDSLLQFYFHLSFHSHPCSAVLPVFSVLHDLFINLLLHQPAHPMSGWVTALSPEPHPCLALESL